MHGSLFIDLSKGYINFTEIKIKKSKVLEAFDAFNLFKFNYSSE